LPYYVYNITNYINLIDSNTDDEAIFLIEPADMSQEATDRIKEMLQPRKLIAKYNSSN